MKWTADHDLVFVREIIVFTPWTKKRGSPERGEIWGRIADSLNSFTTPQFRVNQRSVRDRYTLLERKHKKKVQDEERASGISPEESQLDSALEDIISQFNEADVEHDRISGEKKAKQEAEVSKAEEMRKMALETFKETQKRNESGDEQTTPRKKKRASGSDAIGFLKEKTEMEVKLKTEEMELKRKEFESRKQEQKEKEVQMQQMQQMQQQQLQLLLKQQEQQSAMMMALMEKFLNKP